MTTYLIVSLLTAIFFAVACRMCNDDPIKELWIILLCGFIWPFTLTIVVILITSHFIAKRISK
jgi:hypothetical protein